MTQQSEFPGVFVDDPPAPTRPVVPAATSVALFIGRAPQGPSQPTPVAALAEIERAYGASPTIFFTSLRAFFENGGRTAVVLRLDAPEGDSAAFLAALAAAVAEGGAADAVAFNLMCVPGLVEPPAIAPLQAFCRRKRAFLILDAPAQATIQDVLQTLPMIAGPDAMNAALYYPWVETAAGPSPPCGFVAGVYARTDQTRGLWKAPAGLEASLAGATGLERTLTDDENGVLNPRGVNCLRGFLNSGIVVWGARTLHGDDGRGSDWKYVPVRRMALFIEESLARSLQWTVFEPNGPQLWQSIRLTVGSFLQELFRQGAFAGQTPRDAYFVVCDAATTTQTDVDAGIVNLQVGFAPLKPAEFVVLQIQLKAAV
ncbi:MAG: phage tail protein [Methylocystis sp.]|nr:MAG: phage tail protein [Methylocystis sp.]